MPRQIHTPFECYEFTDEELPSAKVFSSLQIMYLRTELSIAATEKLNLNPFETDTPNSQVKFLLEQEYLRGKCEILQYLINVSEDTTRELADQLAEQQASQQDKQ